MVRNREIVKQFLVAYTSNQLDSIKDILSESVEIDYSNITPVSGRDNVISALTWTQQFDVKRVTTTNTMEYFNDNVQIVGLIAHHLVSYEKNNEMFPFVFGGKYVFTINNTTQLIERISFVLEYQAENTVYMKGLWSFANGHNNYDLLSHFDTGKIYHKAVSERDIATLVNLFFWCLDTKDQDTLDILTAEDFNIARDQSVGHERFQADKETLSAYIKATDNYYNFNQNSIRINEINENTVITVSAQHLTPHRLGTKKLNSMTKYHSFFDEDITVIINNSTLLIQSVDMKKVADVYYNGFDILEY